MLRTTILIIAFVGFVAANVARPIARDSRIVNGGEADDGEFPFMVSLQKTPGGSHICGATIVNDTWVLTAARCVFAGVFSDYQIRAGSNLYQSGGQTRNITKINIHSGYVNAEFWDNDIALLQLDSPLVFDNFVQPATLPPVQFDEYQGPGNICGWGYQTTGGQIQPRLLKANVLVVSDAQCLAAHGTGPTEQMICADGEGTGTGICSFDNGGPLLDSNNVQIGIISWLSVPCATIPAVSTQVSYYIDWINQNMQ